MFHGRYQKTWVTIAGTSENLMARALVRSDSNGLNDEATRALVSGKIYIPSQAHPSERQLCISEHGRTG